MCKEHARTPNKVGKKVELMQNTGSVIYLWCVVLTVTLRKMTTSLHFNFINSVFGTVMFLCGQLGTSLMILWLEPDNEGRDMYWRPAREASKIPTLCVGEQLSPTGLI